MIYHYLKMIFILSFGLIMLQGCIPYFVNIENLAEPKIEEVKKTQLIGLSSQEVIDKFGPPIAVAKRDGPPIYFPRAFKEGSKKYEAEFFLEKFNIKNKNTENHMVYCYQQTVISGGGIIIVVAGISMSGGSSGGAALPLVGTSDTIHTLLLLIDQSTQKVVDVIVEKSE